MGTDEKDPEPTMNDGIANEWVIDLQSVGLTLPAWWDLEGTVDSRSTWGKVKTINR